MSANDTAFLNLPAHALAGFSLRTCPFSPFHTPTAAEDGGEGDGVTGDKPIATSMMAFSNLVATDLLH